MRFSTIVSSLLCLTTVFATPLHQAMVKRSTTDVCVSINLDLDINRHVFGRIDACVCLSTVNLFVKENPIAKLAAKKFGVKKVEELIREEIISHESKQKCHYPPHAIPLPAPKCQPHANPCEFKCNDGFVADLYRRTCECHSPNIVYNGKCIPRPHKPGHPEPSGKPKPRGHY